MSKRIGWMECERRGMQRANMKDERVKKRQGRKTKGKEKCERRGTGNRNRWNRRESERWGVEEIIKRRKKWNPRNKKRR